MIWHRLLQPSRAISVCMVLTINLVILSQAQDKPSAVTQPVNNTGGTPLKLSKPDLKSSVSKTQKAGVEVVAPNPVDLNDAYQKVAAIKLAPDARARLDLAEAFLQQYPKSAYVPLVESAALDAKVELYRIALDQRQTAEAFHWGELLLETQENTSFGLEIQTTLAELSLKEVMKANMNATEWVQRGSVLAKQVIQRVDLGETLTDNAQEQARIMSRMEVLIGLDAKQQNQTDEAHQAFKKAIEYRCENPLAYWFAGSLSQSQYETLARQYNTLSDKQTEEASLLLAQAKDQAQSAMQWYGKAWITTQRVREYRQMYALGQSAKTRLAELNRIIATQPDVYVPKGKHHKLKLQRKATIPSVDQFLQHLSNPCP